MRWLGLLLLVRVPSGARADGTLNIASSGQELSESCADTDGSGVAVDRAVDLSGKGCTYYSSNPDDCGCCDDGDPYVRITRPCEPEACPLWSEPSHLPANPFRARIIGGRCACDAPQVCAE